MTRRSNVVVAGVSLVIMVGLTVVPVGGMAWATEPVTATAIGAVGGDECIEVTFTADATYRVDYPVLDVWGISKVSETSLDHANLTATATGKCAEGIGTMDIDASVVAPTCGIGRCQGETPRYGVGALEVPTTAAEFEGAKVLPDSGPMRGDRCFNFVPTIQYTRLIGGSMGTNTRVTESDLCLNLS
jgi:hypothetical protein